MRMQTALRAVYPPECLACAAQVDREFALCADCWSQTPFILGAACDACGMALPGHSSAGVLHCDTCRQRPPLWDQGRAILSYGGIARQLVLGLKYGDRTDIARAAGPWFARALPSLDLDDPVLVPIPLFRGRLWRRRYNQSALLAQSIARVADIDILADALLRIRATPSLDGKSPAERHALLDGAIAPHPKRQVSGREVLLIDDVMTTGATLGAACNALRDAGAKKVSVMVLARAGKDT